MHWHITNVGWWWRKGFTTFIPKGGADLICSLRFGWFHFVLYRTPCTKGKKNGR